MKDIPYSVLKKDKRSYEIMTLHDQGRTFAALAKEYAISPLRVNRLYIKEKREQIFLYIRHISISLGYETTAKLRKVFFTAYDCYQDLPYICAYFEKKYKALLEEYRAGEPGMPEPFLKALPPLKRTLSPQTISRIVELRETEGATYAAIAKEMRVTPEKARHAYNSFYDQQVLAYVKELQKEAESQEEKEAIWRRYFGTRRPAKKNYERMMEEKRGKERDGAVC